MSQLPLDICREIFLISSAESLIRFRAVCKCWCAVIDDPRFIKAHTNQQLSSTTILIRNSAGPPFYPLYSLDIKTLDFISGIRSISPTPLSITRGGLSRLPKFPVASGNGLMLLPPSQEEHENNNWEIWNPLTHERLQLPRRDSVINSDANGLGYDFATDDYKAVVIACQKTEPRVHRTHVYSLRSDSWKEIANLPSYCYLICPVGVFHSGALHWLTSNSIIVLDLGTESFHQLEPRLPLHERDERDDDDQIWYQTFQIDTLDGCLVVGALTLDDYGYTQCELWVMKDYTSWVKVFTIGRMYSIWCRDIKAVAYMKNKKQVFLQDGRFFYLFDVESDSFKAVSIHGLSVNVSGQFFQGSIFRLHANCGRGGSGTKERIEMKINKSDVDIDSELIFCVRDLESYAHPHYSCFSLDSNWLYSSSEDE